MTDQTHDPKLRSWVQSANDDGADFPLQNLPFGVFTGHNAPADDTSHIGVAIGDQILDVTLAIDLGVLIVPEEITPDFYIGVLNEFMSRSREQWRSVRRSISHLLREDNPELRDHSQHREQIMVPMADAEVEMPVLIGDYTDFYCSIHHATNVGSMFRPDNPLLPNYRHLPIGYHGRASSIVMSGTPIRRPMGQTKADDADLPSFGPCRLLDYEMEMGLYVGRGNALGSRIPMARAGEHLFGMCIVNDWSARDVQKWEYQPLGPFNAKNFATTISPWVVTMEALAPFRIEGPPRGGDDPPILEYLQPVEEYGLDITVEVHLASAKMREQGIDALRVSRGSFRHLYWTVAQMLVHHTSTGCNLQPGDLIASGTVSGPEEESRGCLLERTWRGQNPIELPDGTQRKFLQDGDEVIMTAYCQRAGFRRISFGSCRGVIEPSA